MKISHFTNLCLLALTLLLCLLVGLAAQVLGTLDNIAESERHRHRSLLLANELFQSSEDLTRMARSYVVTADPIYEQHFSEILDIRNGKRPRPLDYSATYWHLADIDKASASALGAAIPLQELMQREGLSEQELDLLRQSQTNSDTLVKLERQAFAAMKGWYDDGHGNFTVQRAPDRNFAISLLFGEHYKAEKARIMTPLKKFMQELDNRTQTTLTDLQSQFQRQILLILAVLCLALLGVAIAAIYMRRNILRPLDFLSRQTSSIAQGSYTARCDIPSHNEIGRLGADFNIMAEAIERDINTREQANERLHQSELRLNEAQRLAKVGSWDFDLVSGKLHWSNEVFRIFEVDPSLFSGRYEDFLNVIHPDDRTAVDQAYNSSLATRLPYEITHRLRLPDGRIKWVSEHCQTSYDNQGKALRSIGTVQDITERKQAEQRIVQMATHDMLTGLPNRHLLQDRIAQALAHDRRSQEQAAVLFIDLDHFKIINDSLGHAVGDALLQEVAERLTSTIRSEDTAARQGGDEFIVLLPNIAGALDAQAVAQKILDALIQPFHIHGKELHISGSIGIALFPDNGKDVGMLLKNGDIAMYHAKESGRNNCQFFSTEMNKLATERHSLGSDLRHALERNELLLYFQPVIDMSGGKLTSMEVLLRWQHPSQGLILPDQFIVLAEESGMIVPIGE